MPTKRANGEPKADFHIYLPPRLVDAIRKRAAENGRTLSTETELTLWQYYIGPLSQREIPA